MVNRRHIVAVLLVSTCGCVSRLARADRLGSAARNGDITEMRRLLASGVAVDGRAMHNMTALMHAAKANRVEACGLLLEHGADVNAHNESGSVLMWAVHSGNSALVQLLLRAGVDRSWRNALGESAEDHARALRRDAIADLIRDSPKDA